MKNQVIDFTGLSPKKIAMVEEIITAFKAVSQKNNYIQNINQKSDKARE
ncbi:MAG: hypothetical protein QNJ68_10475 [Microcoleaceae cyanobacterium MO_207.B10]|nr:hypothetical protein [Microcoleaceae cyanobacterium MO_207.B10]